MNIGVWACAILAIPFSIIGIFFSLLKEKGAKFVSGFNSLSETQQQRYDKAHISRDMRNQCFTWANVMVLGALCSYLFSPYLAIVAYIIWLVLFFKEFHLDAEKAFEKYLLK